MQAAERGVLRCMSGVSLKDRIKNWYIKGSRGVVDIRDKLREHRLRCFGRVTRRGEDDLVKVIMGLRVEGRRSRGRPKLTFGAGGKAMNWRE